MLPSTGYCSTRVPTNRSNGGKRRITSANYQFTSEIPGMGRSPMVGGKPPGNPRALGFPTAAQPAGRCPAARPAARRGVASLDERPAPPSAGRHAHRRGETTSSPHGPPPVGGACAARSPFREASRILRGHRGNVPGLATVGAFRPCAAAVSGRFGAMRRLGRPTHLRRFRSGALRRRRLRTGIGAHRWVRLDPAERERLTRVCREPSWFPDT